MIEPDGGAAVATLDRELGRLEGRLQSLEATVARLERAVQSLLAIIDFGSRMGKLAYGAVAMIGLDSASRIVLVILHAVGLR